MVLSFWRAPLNLSILINMLISSLLLNLVQFVITICYFLPEKTRLDYIQRISTVWFRMWPFLIEIFEGIDVTFYGDTTGMDGNTLILTNHNPDLDCIPGSILVDKYGYGMGRTMVLMKNALRFVPGLGTMHYFQGSLFLTRHWDKDVKRLAAKMHAMDSNHHPHPFAIAVFPEGTRITKEKMMESWKFSEERGLPKFNNVLIPRKKGFVYICESLPKALDYIYLLTCTYDGNTFKIIDLLRGNLSSCKGVHMHIKSVKFSTLPKDEEELYNWLIKEWQEVDNRIGYFKEHHKFPEPRAAPNYSFEAARLLSLFRAYHCLSFLNAVVISFFWPNVAILSLVAQALVWQFSHRSLNTKVADIIVFSSLLKK